jgi:hypothetical protein
MERRVNILSNIPTSFGLERLLAYKKQRYLQAQ